MNPTPPRHGPTDAQIFLGLFILWQLLFLFGANFLSILREIRDDEYDVYHAALPKDWKEQANALAPGWLKKEGHVHDALEVVFHGLTSRWEELTGQPQYWKLFAPDITRYPTFVAVELRWDDVTPQAPGKSRPRISPVALPRIPDRAGDPRELPPHPPELLLSDNEPPDLRHFFRVGRFRMRKYESQLDLVLRVNEDETRDEAVTRWRKRIKEHVRKMWDNILPYLKMRWRDFLARNPDCPEPRQVILIVRRYVIPAPEEFSEDWYRPESVPIARWLPGVPPDEDNLEIEWFNPRAITDRGVEGEFERLPR